MIFSVRQQKLFIFWLMMLLLFGIGYGAGSAVGRSTISKLYSLKHSFVSLIFTPAISYYETALLINSTDELKRISGYYSLLDGVVPPEAGYLKECYVKEDSSSAKAILLWVFTRLDDKEAALETLNSLCESVVDDDKIRIAKTIDILKEKIEK